MPGFADFLAEAAGDRGLGRALGGKSEHQRRVDMFVNDQLPKFAQEIERGATRQDIERGARGLLASGLQAGLQPAALDKLMDMVVQPALRNVQGQELEGIRRDYGPQTTPLTPQVAPEMQGQPLSPQTTFAPQTTPGKPKDDDWAMRMFQATGAQPQHLENIFKTPSAIQENVAKAGVEGEKLQEAQRKARALEDLPSTPQPGGMISPRAMGQIHPPGLTQYEPQREPAGATLDLKRQGLEIQQQRLQVLADRVASGQATAGERQALAQQKLELDRAKFELQKQGSETEREPALNAADTEIFMNAIREEAVRTGKTSPEDLKALAAKRGLILEGTPTIEETGGIRGFFTDKSLGGSMRLRRAPVVTTKKPGQAPTGQPPAGQAVPPGHTLMENPADGSQMPVPNNRVNEFKQKGARVVGAR